MPLHRLLRTNLNTEQSVAHNTEVDNPNVPRFTYDAEHCSRLLFNVGFSIGAHNPQVIGSEPFAVPKFAWSFAHTFSRLTSKTARGAC